jgi:hypothetical protein
MIAELDDTASSRQPRKRGKTPPVPPAGPRLLREVQYWEAAYDRLTEESRILKLAHDEWMRAHEIVVRQIHQWETWYKSLEADRDLYKKWEAEKAADLQRALHDSSTFGEQIQQWVAWYQSLEAERDLYKQWDSDKKGEIGGLLGSVREFQQNIDRMQEESSKILSLLERRDSEVRQLKAQLENEGRQHSARVHEWETWYKSLQADRDLYKAWDAEKKIEIDRQRGLSGELVKQREFWMNEHAKVVGQVQRWVAWFRSTQNERDQWRQVAEVRQGEIERQERVIHELRSYLEKVFRNPLHYIGILMHRLVGRKP